MKENFISNKASVLDALSILDKTSNGIYTLFVVDNNNEQLLGTLTDGDIRRYLIAGGNITDTVSNAMNTKFKSIKAGEQNLLAHIHNLRELGVWVIPILDNEGHVLEIFNLRTHKSLLPIDAVLMAGGKGERLRPLTENTPKPLIKVGEKCIIDYNIDRLLEFGVKQLNVTVNYLGEQLERHFAEPRNGIKIHTVYEPQFLGTIGSIKYVNKFYNDTILVMNSDIFTDIDFEDFYLHFREHNADMSVAAIPFNVSIPLGILNLEGRNITGIIEKPKYNYYANAGIYLIKKSVLDEIPENTFFHATDLIKRLIEKGKTVIRYPLNGTWIDIGQPADLIKARDLVKHLNKR